jgi:hypothetical protein
VLIAGLFRGMSPVLVKRRLAHASVSACDALSATRFSLRWRARLCPSAIFWRENSADLERAADRLFLLAKATLKGIEELSFKDGAAAALVVAGVLVLRWG